MTISTDKIKDTVVINPSLFPPLPPSFDIDSTKSAVCQAIDKVVPHFVKMSVDLALQKTKAYVLRDDPLGTSDSLRNSAACMMVTSLAQRYAKKMCKEPLRGWMFSLLHGSLQVPYIHYETRCTIVDSIISDNIELICMGIQEMARTEVALVIEDQVRSWIYPSNVEENIMAVKEKFKAGISEDEMKDLLDSLFVFVGDKFEALLEAIFSGVEKDFAKVLEEKKSYLSVVMEPLSQGLLLEAIKNYYINKSTLVSFKEELPAVFKCLLTAPSLVDQSDFIKFFEIMKNKREATTSIWQSVKNLLDRRLQGGTVQDRFTWIV